MATFSEQQQLDKLSGLIGSEQSTRDQLAATEQEIAGLTTALTPLESKRGELTARLDAIEAAKVESANIKQG